MIGPEKQLAPAYTERMTCRACDSTTLASVLDLGTHSLPWYLESGDDEAPKAPLNLVRCAQCAMLQLQHSVDPDLLYREFWYRSSMNQTMKDALSDLVNRTVEHVKEGVWLDIGANDGYLLSRVPETFTRIACEPAQNFEPQLKEHAHVVVPTYFSAQAVREQHDGPVDVITSAACFYDVSDPNAFVRDVADLLAPEGVWVNQLNDSPTMLRRNAFDSICHEHVCYYDLHVLKTLYAEHGLKIVSVTHNEVNGGSMRVFASKSGAEVDLIVVPSVTQQGARCFAERVVRWKDQVSSLLKNSDLFRFAPVWLYGASTKGSTLLQYLGCNESFLAAADRNPAKWGRRMAGTGIPVVSEAEMRKARPKFLMVLPWAFAEEFNRREMLLRQHGTTMVYPLPDFRMVL
jgi:hypothetical protein